MKPPEISNMQIVPEDMIKWCAAQLEGEENTFAEFLVVADQFRMAGLTPIFLCSNTLKDLYVTTKEKLQKNYH